MPALGGLMARHPQLRLELGASNEQANLTRRDTDLALRATKKPPEHLVGRHLGVIRVAVFASKRLARGMPSIEQLAALPWAVPDEALPDHPSVRWRRKHLPKATSRLEVHGILAVMEAIAAGLAVGVVPLFLAGAYADVTALTEPLAECETDLWLLAHPESRHLRRISVVAAGLAQVLRLDA
jgi:DNA-binding transcriptional LysR family regulator